MLIQTVYLIAGGDIFLSFPERDEGKKNVLLFAVFRR